MANTTLPNSMPISSPVAAAATGQSSSASDSARQCNWQRSFWAAWVASFTLLATGLLWGKWQTSTLPQRSYSPVDASKNIKLGKGDVKSRSLTKPIEEIRVGERVLADNPSGETDLTLGKDIEPAKWRKLELRAKKSNGGWCDIVLLRPAKWVETNTAVDDKSVLISVPECGIDGWAELVSVAPCSPIESGSGNVVTGTYRHSSSRVFAVFIEGKSDPIEVSGNHRIWSADRRLFVRVDEILQNETLTTKSGTCRVSKIRPLPGEAVVYNLEVHLSHVYYVTQAGILVHNSEPTIPASGSGDTVTLYHGSPGAIEGGEFDLEIAKKLKRPGTQVPGVYLTDDYTRAATGYGRGGTVTRVVVSKEFAKEIFNMGGPNGNQPEFVAKTPEQVKVINDSIKKTATATKQPQTLPTTQATRLWACGGF